MNIENEKIKGAFKHLPVEEQPQRIPIALIPKLQQVLTQCFSHLGELYFCDIVKRYTIQEKESCGDLDVLFVPRHKSWKTSIISSSLVCAHEGNSAQLMTIIKPDLREDIEDCYSRTRYMIDFLVVRPGGLEFKKLFYGYGTTVSALLGSFARSIAYKFTDYALYKRVKDSRNQWHNIELTTNPGIALKILDLNPDILKNECIYKPDGVASWIARSCRFDSRKWQYGDPDKISVGIPINKNARDAIKKGEDTAIAYKILNSYNIESRRFHNLYFFEELYLGEEKVKQIKEEVERVTVNTEIVLTGQEIMDLLHIKPGPKIGEIQKWLAQEYGMIPYEERRSERSLEMIKLATEMQFH